jgi:hypothetical protein
VKRRKGMEHCFPPDNRTNSLKVPTPGSTVVGVSPSSTASRQTPWYLCV